MDVLIKPSKLKGTIKAIPSKSDLHRILIGAACCKTQVRISTSTKDLSDDIFATMNCLIALGADISVQSDHIMVTPLINRVPLNSSINCNESGSTLRFLLPVVSALGIEATIHGKGRLPNRPLSPLKEQMIEHGAVFSNETLPFTLSGKLKAGKYQLAGDVSSQYISGLLFGLSLLNEDSEIILTTPLQSKSYVDMTVHTITQFGGHITELCDRYLVKGVGEFSMNREVNPEGDWSNSCFWVASGAIGEEIELCGLNAFSLQGDKEILEIAKRFGAKVTINNDAFTIQKNLLTATDIDAANIPDAVIPIAIIAAVSEGTTRIFNAKRLKLKESDRLLSTYQLIKSLGGDIELTEDGLIINGKEHLSGGVVDGFNDHRIVMAAAIASSVCKGDIYIKGAEAVNKSYKNFFEDFIKLGGIANVIDDRK